MAEIIYQGQKGGSKEPHQPVETPNNLLSKSYAKVLVAVGEGELGEYPTGQDIFLGGTPLLNASSQPNFEGVKWEWRSGTVDQTYIQGMPEVSTEYTVGVELKDTTPWTQSFTSPSLDAVRITLQWPSILRQKDNGDIVGYNIVYAIDISTDGSPFVQYGQWDTNNGKTNTTYERTHRVDLPRNASSWTIRVRRITPNQNSSQIQDTMYVKTYAEVLDAKFRYPNTALLYVEFDAELFGGTSIPAISVRTKGKVVRVPTNYDPETRTYVGVWNGAFKWAWTDNPAWVFYDIVTNERYGLGQRITPDMVDKWTLYQVSQYCDVMVSDGQGGMEPRHTCNVYIQSREDAWNVLRDIVGVFNGMLYWNGTQLVAQADQPVDINSVRTYNRSNVIDGQFEYASTSANTVFTAAIVSYDNPDNHFNTATEAVNELSLVQRYKYWSQADIAAFGCTSRGEAQRKGKYTLLTNSLNRLVSFKLGMEGYLPKPGEVIGVADQILAGANLSGRIHGGTATVVTLDRVSNAVNGDILYINKADGTAEGRTISNVAGNTITVSTAFSSAPEQDLGWYVEKTTLKSQLFRVTKVSWDDESVQFTVTAVQYEDSKYAAIDNGARLEQRPITTVPAGFIAAPASVTVSSYTYLEQTMAVTSMNVTWPAVDGASSYEAEWRKDGGDWRTVGKTYATTFDVKGIYKGGYEARVRAVNSQGTKSAWTISALTPLDGKVGSPPALASFTTASEVWGIRLNWTFAPGSDDALFVQLQQADDVNGAVNLVELGYQSYPTKTYLKSDMMGAVIKYFRVRLIDRSGLESAWTPWTYGISEYGTDKILEELTGQITETQLGEDLLSEIDKISGDGPGSVNERIDTAVDELQQQIDDITDALVYDPTKTYLQGDIVRIDNKLYQALQNVPVNTPPPNATYWEDIGKILEDANGLATQVEQNTVDIQEIDGIVTYQAKTINSLQAKYREDDGTGDLQDALNGWNSQAAIIEERLVRSDADSALASSLVSYKAQVDGNLAQLNTQIVVVSNKTDATATQVTTLDAKVDSNQALLTTQIQTVADAQSATASQVTNLQATVGNNTSAIQVNANAIATTNNGLAAMYSIKLGVQSDGKYYAAGMGIGIENTPSGMQSQVLFVADRFAILNQINGVTSSPFIVQGGQTIINNAIIGDGTITNAKIGNVIQSTATGTNGQPLWQLNKGGTFQLNSATSGGRMQITSEVLRIYDGSGVLRIKLGNLDI